MSIARSFELFLLASLATLVGLGVIRWLMLRARGVRVLAVDRQRSIAQGLTDLAQLVCLLGWAYAVVGYAWPLATPPGPAWFGVVLLETIWAKAAGALLLLGGLAIYALALRAFGDSWRLGIDRQRPGALVTSGVFAWIRNPIYLALDLFFAGAFLVEGRVALLLLALANAALFHQLIRREETFLADRYGDAYREYGKRVGRYVTWR